jgi:hypothetical protein
MNDVALYDHIGCPAGQNTIVVSFAAQKSTRFPSYRTYTHPLSPLLFFSAPHPICPNSLSLTSLSLSLTAPLSSDVHLSDFSQSFDRPHPIAAPLLLSAKTLTAIFFVFSLAQGSIVLPSSFSVALALTLLYPW